MFTVSAIYDTEKNHIMDVMVQKLNDLRSEIVNRQKSPVNTQNEFVSSPSISGSQVTSMNENVLNILSNLGHEIGLTISYSRLLFDLNESEVAVEVELLRELPDEESHEIQGAYLFHFDFEALKDYAM